MDSNPPNLEERCRARSEALEAIREKIKQAEMLAATTTFLANRLFGTSPLNALMAALDDAAQVAVIGIVEKTLYELCDDSTPMLAEIAEIDFKLVGEVAVKWLETFTEDRRNTRMAHYMALATLSLKVHLKAASHLYPATTSQIHDDYDRAFASSFSAGQDAATLSKVLDKLEFTRDEYGVLRLDASRLVG